MIPKRREESGAERVASGELRIEWRDYDRIEPGEYSAFCTWAKSYRDGGFKRWTCLLRFEVFSGDGMRVIARVPWWLNLGDKAKPHAARRGRYFREWGRANGGPPARGDRLSPRVFVRRMARVAIADTNAEAPYSVVREVIEWQTGQVGACRSPPDAVQGHSVSKSHSQGRHG